MCCMRERMYVTREYERAKDLQFCNRVSGVNFTTAGVYACIRARALLSIGILECSESMRKENKIKAQWIIDQRGKKKNKKSSDVLLLLLLLLLLSLLSL